MIEFMRSRYTAGQEEFLTKNKLSINFSFKWGYKSINTQKIGVNRQFIKMQPIVYKKKPIVVAIIDAVW